MGALRRQATVVPDTLPGAARAASISPSPGVRAPSPLLPTARPGTQLHPRRPGPLHPLAARFSPRGRIVRRVTRPVRRNGTPGEGRGRIRDPGRAPECRHIGGCRRDRRLDECPDPRGRTYTHGHGQAGRGRLSLNLFACLTKDSSLKLIIIPLKAPTNRTLSLRCDILEEASLRGPRRKRFGDPKGLVASLYVVRPGLARGAHPATS